MVENLYNGNTRKINTKRDFAERHNHGDEFVICSVLIKKSPEIWQKDLYTRGVSEIIENKDKALNRAQHLNNQFKIYDPSTIPSIMESITQSNDYINI